MSRAHVKMTAGLIGGFGRLLGWAVILAVPALGVWLASSLVAEQNGPRWAIVSAGILLCPVLPLAWEAVAEWRRVRRRREDEAEPTRILTRGDRILLRTLALNIPFLLVMLLAFPDRALSAIATRGDWMLDGVEHEVADWLRAGLQGTSDRLQAWNGSFDDDTWAELAETDTTRVPTRDELPVEPTSEEVARGVGPGDEIDGPPAPDLVAITIVPFEDATFQVRDEAHAGGRAFRVERGDAEVAVSVTFPDRLRLRCPIVPAGDQTWQLASEEEQWRLLPADADGAASDEGEEPDEESTGSAGEPAPETHPLAALGIPCEIMRGANPTWSVELRLQPPDAFYRDLDGASARRIVAQRADLDVALQAADGTWIVLGPVVVGPDEVVAIENVPPYYRLRLAAEASERLCAETQRDRSVYRRLGVVADGELRFAPLIGEALCTGHVPLETGERAIHHRPRDAVLPDAAAASERWPIHPEPHPLASSLRAESIAELGRRVREIAEPEPERAKLVHDWIIHHTRYDRDSLDPQRRRPQDADTVFRTGLAVCAGYANLFVALAEAAGLEAAYVVGQVRQLDGEIAGVSHAWNAVKLGGRWALVDVTWDDAIVDGVAVYETSFLFTPPEVFRHSHLPTHDAWQLHPTPINRGEFLRQPIVRPAFFAARLELVSPNRSQVDASREVRIELRNPLRRSILAQIDEQRCDVSGRADLTIRCPVRAGARHDVRLFESATPVGSHRYVGGVRVNGR